MKLSTFVLLKEILSSLFLKQTGFKLFSYVKITNYKPTIIINSTSRWRVTLAIHQFIAYSILFGIQNTDLFSKMRDTLHNKLDIDLSHQYLRQK